MYIQIDYEVCYHIDIYILKYGTTSIYVDQAGYVVCLNGIISLYNWNILGLWGILVGYTSL